MERFTSSNIVKVQIIVLLMAAILGWATWVGAAPLVEADGGDRISITPPHEMHLVFGYFTAENLELGHSTSTVAQMIETQMGGGNVKIEIVSGTVREAANFVGVFGGLTRVCNMEMNDHVLPGGASYRVNTGICIS